MADEFYYTIQTDAVSEFKDRGSKFIAYAYPISGKEEFKSRLAALKKEHPKASHHCFAYRIGMDGNEFRVSDDGEPSGTAGRPILGQIDSRKLTNVLVVVVRYFGGTLLGVPGLINAYKTSTSLALDTAKIIQQPVLISFSIEFDYMKMNDIMRLVRKYDCSILKQDISLFCQMEVGVPVGRADDLKIELKNIPLLLLK